MTGSGRVVCMVGLQKFVGCTDHRRLVACLSAYPFDPRAHRGIGNVPEVPRYRIIDAVRDGDGNMRSVRNGFVRNRAEIKQKPSTWAARKRGADTLWRLVLTPDPRLPAPIPEFTGA